MNKKEWIMLVLAVLGSMLVYALIHPNLIIASNRSFLDCDQRLDFIATFSLVNQFFQGHIPLWAPYDQMSLSYYYLGLGRDNFFNLVTALFCTPFLAISEHPGESFLLLYSKFYFLLLLTVRTIGSYLLLKKFCNKKIILIPSVIFLSCFLSLTFEGDSAKNFYPLIMYLILLTIERLKTMDLMALLLLLSIQIGSSFVLFGFTCQSMHFFMLSALGYHFFLNREKPLSQSFQLKSTPGEIYFYWAMGLACFLSVLPNVLLWLTTFHDLSYQNNDTRTSHIFDIPFYLQSKSYYAQGTFSQLINPTNITCWPFIGYATVLTALYGLLMSRDKQKLIFLFSIIGSFSITASSKSYFGLPGHLLNIFTNPFHFLIHEIPCQIARIIPYFFFPLSILGIGHIFDTNQDSSNPKTSLKRKVFAFSTLLLVLWGIASTSGTSRIYVYIQAFLAFSFIIFMYFDALKKKMGIVMVAMFLLDVPFLLAYHPNQLTSSFGHWNDNVPSFGIKNYDYQNPLITPFRLFFGATPFTGKGDILFNPCNMPGTFLRFTNMTKNFTLPNEELPRHKSFDTSLMDTTMQEYLMPDPIFIFEANKAVKASDKTFKEIIKNHDQRHIVMIEDARHQLNLPDYDGYSTGNTTSPSETFSYHQTVFKPSDGILTKENGLIYLSIKLPEDWPLFMSSTFLTQDRALIKIFIVDTNGKTTELQPSMGKPIEPYSFDIRNYDDGLTIALPMETFYAIKNLVLLRLVPNHTNVWKYNSDQTGLDYKADVDGWLVIHYPYDQRWRITVNEKIVPFYKANKIFISIPISKGPNHILIEYMPDSWLRPLIAIAMALSVAGAVFIMIYAISSSFQ